jgi:hypothetical protein
MADNVPIRRSADLDLPLIADVARGTRRIALASELRGRAGPGSSAAAVIGTIGR